MAEAQPGSSGFISLDVLVCASFAGLVTGLGEGAGLTGLQHANLLAWKFPPVGGGPEMLWISAAFDFIIFLLVGCTVLVLQRWISLLRRVSVLIFLFSLLLFLSWTWVLFSDRVQNYSLFVLSAGLAAVLARWTSRHENGICQLLHRGLPVAVGVFALAFISVQGGTWFREHHTVAKLPHARAESPNVFLIIVDTLRSDHLSSYGYERLTTPRVDALAREGVLFENAFAPAPWTLPSHASLLTGLPPSVHHTDDINRPLPPNFLTIAEEFEMRSGYRTAAFSGNTVFFTRLSGFSRGFSHFEDCCETVTSMIVRTVFGRQLDKLRARISGRLGEERSGWKDAAAVTDTALKWIDKGSNNASKRPLFVVLNYFDVHDPALLRHSDRVDFSSDGKVNIDSASKPAAARARTIDGYDSALAYIDRNIGRLIDGLQDRGIASNTIIVITSDHGELLGEHGLYSHRQSLYRAEIQVPLIFWSPGHVPSGARVSTPVSILDVGSTILQLSGSTHVGAFPGRSLAELWLSPNDRDSPLPASEVRADPWTPHDKKGPACYGWMKSVLNSDWQYIVHEKFGESVYRWKDDPSEMDDKLSTAAGRAAARVLSERLALESTPGKRVSITNIR